MSSKKKRPVATKNDPAEVQRPDTVSSEEQPPDIEALRAELEAAKTKAEQNWDDFLRARAELDNQRKRTAREIEEAHKFALQEFVGTLLPVKDSLEKGLEAASGENTVDANAIREGIELTLEQCRNAFAAAGLEEVDPLGEKFDPERHHVMNVRREPDVEPNIIVSVYQKGYILNGRLIRPALVEVSGEG